MLNGFKEQIDGLFAGAGIPVPTQLSNVVDTVARIEDASAAIGKEVIEDFTKAARGVDYHLDPLGSALAGLISALDELYEANPSLVTKDNLQRLTQDVFDHPAAVLRGLQLSQAMETYRGGVLFKAGVLDQGILELLLGARSPVDVALLWKVARQNGHLLTAENKKALEVDILRDHERLNMLVYMTELIKIKGFTLSIQQILNLAQMDSDGLFELLCVVIAYPDQVEDESIFDQASSRRYGSARAFIDACEFSSDTFEVGGYPFTREQTDQLLRLAWGSSNSRNDSGVLRDGRVGYRSVSYIAVGNVIRKVETYISTVRPLISKLSELAPENRLTAERVAALAQMSVDRLLQLRTITAWLALHPHLLNEGTLSRLLAPESDQVCAVLARRTVCAAIGRALPAHFTSDLWDVLHVLAGITPTTIAERVVVAYIDDAAAHFERRQTVAQGPSIDRQNVHSSACERSVYQSAVKLWDAYKERLNQTPREEGVVYCQHEIYQAIQAGQESAENAEESRRWTICEEAADHVFARFTGTPFTVEAGPVPLSLTVADAVDMAWIALHDSDQRVQEISQEQAREMFLMTAFCDSGQAYKRSNGMTCVKGFFIRVIQGLLGVVRGELVDIVLETYEMAANRFRALVPEAVLEHLGRNSDPQTAEDYRTIKAELDQLFATDSEIPKSICQAIQNQVREQIAEQFPTLNADPLERSRLDALVEYMSFAPVMDPGSPMRDERENKFKMIQERLEASRGAGLDKIEKQPKAPPFFSRDDRPSSASAPEDDLPEDPKDEELARPSFRQ